MRILRQRAVDKRQLIDVHVEIYKEDARELERVKEEMIYNSKKTKFERKDIEDME